MGCLNCGNELVNTPGKKPKQFCGISCRSNYWQKKKRDESGPSAKKPGRPKKITPEIQNADLILPGGLGDVKFPNGQTAEIVRSLSNPLTGSVTLTIAPFPECVDTAKDPVSLDLPALVRKAEQDTRKVLNPDDPKTKQKKEPAEGTNAFYLKYGAFTKKDILK